MDTKTLVVGQEVSMSSNAGFYDHGTGKVVEVTPSGVVVQQGQALHYFDKNGIELEDSRRHRLGFGPSPESKFHTILWQCAPEFRPLELDDIPFAERTALRERASRERKERTKS